MEEQVPPLIKKKRLWRLIELQKNISNTINQTIVGKTVEIMVENKSKKGIEDQYWGKTRTNKIVVFSYVHNDNLLGKFVYVKIKKADTYHLFGELIDIKIE
jgi:tRNA-2-methylthio-N6-dimethylallyladenosine synthase